MARGDWTELDGTWIHATAMAAYAGVLYVADGGAIYRVAPDGTYDAISDDEWRPRHLVGAAGALIAIEPDGGMYRVDPGGAGYEKLAGDWRSARVVAVGGDALFVIEDSGALYRVSATDGSHAELGDDYQATELLVAAGGGLVAFEGSGAMYRVSPKDGAYTLVAADWAGARVAAGDAARAYVLVGETFYEVDPATGAHAALNDDAWRTRLAAVCGDALYVLEDGGALFRIEL